MATILVATPVHHPDDPRIREKLIRTLAREHTIRFAAALPGPSDHHGLEWVPLPGGRLRRNLRLWRLALFSRYDVLSLHDPEALPVGIVVRLLRRRRVVFDVHERIPEQARRRLPGPLGSIGAWLLLRLLRLVERLGDITLAEAGYRDLMRRDHPVFPNHLVASALPEPVAEGDGTAVYVGDVTAARGVMDLVAAAAGAGIGLVLIGRIGDDLRRDITERAADSGLEVDITGPMPHRAAMERVAGASVGVSPLRDHPNYRHSLPTKALEYAALGLPVVASDLPGTRAVLQGLDGVWLFEPGDVAALRSALAEAAAPGSRPPPAQAHDVRRRYAWPEEAVLALYSGTGRN